MHVRPHLVVVLGLGRTELEIDDDPFVTVRHHTVRTVLPDLPIFYGEDGTLVEERPPWGEPVGHLRVTETLAEHPGDLVGRDMIVVDDTLELELTEGIVDIGGGTDGGEYLMEHTASLDIVAVLFVILVLASHEVTAAVALSEDDLTLLMAEIDGERLRGLEEGVGGSGK